MNIRILTFITGGILLLTGCSEPPKAPPADIIPEEKFISIMVDVQLTEALKNQQILAKRNNPDDILAAYHRFLEKHHVTAEQFLKTYAYYRDHPQDMQAVYEKVLDSLNKMNMMYRTDLELAHDSLFADSASVREIKTYVAP